MPIGASASRTAALESAGSRSQLPMLLSAVVVVVMALWFTDVLASIPTAALAGLVANAVVSTINVAEFRALARMRRTEFFIALGCTAGVLILGPMGGIVVALVATMVDTVQRISSLPAVTLREPATDPDTGRFTASDAPAAARPAGIEFIRFAGPLFFANADALRDRAVASAATDVRWVVFDFEAVIDVDPTAYEALAEAVELLAAAGKTVAITRAPSSVVELLDRYGFGAVASPTRWFESNRAAMLAFEAADATDR
jgi:MFS superfamily sulfate permease-like transporter